MTGGAGSSSWAAFMEGGGGVLGLLYGPACSCIWCLAPPACVARRVRLSPYFTRISSPGLMTFSARIATETVPVRSSVNCTNSALGPSAMPLKSLAKRPSLPTYFATRSKCSISTTYLDSLSLRSGLSRKLLFVSTPP